MAIDTPAKRSSSLDHEEPWQFCAPLPDGAIDQGDRQHSIWSYCGILAGAAVVNGIVGAWSNVQRISAERTRIEVSADRKRVEVTT